MDNLINNLEDRMADRKHTAIFSILSPTCLSEHFNLDTFAILYNLQSHSPLCS